MAVDDASSDQRGKISAIYFLLLAINGVAWGFAVIALADRPTLLGTAVLAYVLGLRHAFDADHIAAIDNVVRKLMQQGQKPLGVGFFFSLGHSSIVVIASAIIPASAAALQGPLEQFHQVGGVIGTLVSAFFLLAIGVANLIILRG